MVVVGIYTKASQNLAVTPTAFLHSKLTLNGRGGGQWRTIAASTSIGPLFHILMPATRVVYGTNSPHSL